MKKNINTNLIGKKERINEAIAYLKGKRIVKTQKEIAELLKIDAGNLSKILKGNESYLTDPFLSKFADTFKLNTSWLIDGIGEIEDSLSQNNTSLSNEEFLLHISEPEPRLNPTTKDVLNQLSKIKSNKEKEKSSTIVDDNKLVDAIEIVVPYKGQAGLSSKLYPEEIIEEFEKRRIKVKPEHRGIFYTIEVDGNSMPPDIRPKDWLRCEEISSLYWLEKNFFKKNKIYCIWHNERGIIFKRIIYKGNDLWCSSDNDDKNKYPDFKLDLNVVRKILQVKKLVSRDY